MYDNQKQHPQYKNMAHKPSTGPSLFSTFCYAFVLFVFISLSIVLWLSVAPANFY